MITGKIDVTKIDKAKLFKGEKGTYLDIVLFETPDDKFGNDYRIAQSVSKEDREKGIKGAILGNAKSFKRPGASRPTQEDPTNYEQEEVPF